MKKSFILIICLFSVLCVFAQEQNNPSSKFSQIYEKYVNDFKTAIDFSSPVKLSTYVQSDSSKENENGTKEASETSQANETKQEDLASETNQANKATEESEAKLTTKEKFSVEDIVQLSLKNNPSLKASTDSALAAQAELDGAKARRLPSLSLSSSASLIGNPVGPISITKGQLGSYGGVDIPSEDVLVYKGMESTLYNFGIKAEIPIFTWGKIEIGIDLAKAGLNAAEIELEKAEHEMAIKIHANMDALAYVIKTIDILNLQKEICARLLYISEKSEESGFITQTDLSAVKIKLKETDIALARVEEQRDKILSDLSTMSGIELSSTEQLDIAMPKADCPIWTQEECRKLAIKGSYDLSLLDALLFVKKGVKDLAEKEAKGLPDIGMQIELTYGGQRFPFLETDWYGKDDYQLTISLGTSGSLFGDKVKAGAAAKARAELSKTESQKNDAERSIKAYIRSQYLAIDLAKAKLEYANLVQDGFLLELAQKSSALEAGAGEESEYLSKMIEALASLAEAYGTIAEYRIAVVSLEAIVGKTF